MRQPRRAAPLLGLLRPANASDLSATGRAYLLDVTFARHRFGISIMPLVALPLIWLFSRAQDPTLLVLWASFFLVFAIGLQGVWRQYAHDVTAMESPQLLSKWQPRIEYIALVHGAGLSMPVVLTGNHATYEFMLLLYVTISAITASNATRQNASLGVFFRFFLSGWMTCIALIVWVFPLHWHYLLPLSLLFAIAIYRDVLDAHRFFVDQIRLEERSKHLIGQLEAARDDAQKLLQEKNLFLSTASHDLRQPMHAMSMLVEAAAHRNRDSAVAPLLVDLKTGMGSMNMMFNSLLDLSRLESGAVAQRAAPVRLQPMLNDIVTMFREQASQRGLKLRIHVPTNEAFVWADPALLRQALVNLVHNALRYTKHGGLLVGMRQRSTAWQIEVWDTGIGIAAEDGPQIFSPYYRSQHAWRLHSAGHGLGLAVVARCARLMDAPLDFKSRLGKGSCFWLRLPMYQPDELAEPLSKGSAIGLDLPLRQLSGCCLVLDDDPQVISAWKALLDAWGVTGQYASDGAQAMHLLGTGFVPNMIFCDQRLRSGESGFEILKALLSRHPQACGAMVSGEFHSTELQDAENEGYLVLHKPLEPAQLHAVLSAWLMHYDQAEK
jgi:signal transduction histidine kinase/CheY-like chemotaxis protein